MNWCEGKNEDIGVGGFQEVGCTLGRQFGWLHGSGQVHHLSDEFNCPCFIPEGGGSCLWGNVPRESLEGQGKCWQKGTQKYVNTQLSSERRAESSSWEVDQHTEN